jgi:hypothetical protein
VLPWEIRSFAPKRGLIWSSKGDSPPACQAPRRLQSSVSRYTRHGSLALGERLHVVTLFRLALAVFLAAVCWYLLEHRDIAVPALLANQLFITLSAAGIVLLVVLLAMIWAYRQFEDHAQKLEASMQALAGPHASRSGSPRHSAAQRHQLRRAEMKLIPNRRRTWRMASVQIAGLTVGWAALLDATQAAVLDMLHVPAKFVPGVLGVLVICVRLIRQPKLRGGGSS